MSGSSPTSNPESSSSTGDAAVPPEKPVVKIPEPVKIEEPAPAILSPHLPPPVTPPPVIASSSPKTSVGDGGRGGIVSRLRGDTPDEGGPRMSFIDHLMELRKRLWVSIITVVVSMFGALAFYDWLFAILRWPLDKINDEYRLPENAANYAKILELLKLPAN